MVGAIAVIVACGWQKSDSSLAGAVLTIGAVIPTCWVVPRLKQRLDDPERLQSYPEPTGIFGLSMGFVGIVSAGVHVCFCISLLQCEDPEIGLFVCAVSTSALTMVTTCYLIHCARSTILKHKDVAEWYRTNSHSKQMLFIMVLSSFRLDTMGLLRLRICSQNLLVECPMRPEHFQWLRYAGVYHCVVEDLAYVMIAALKLVSGCDDSSVTQDSDDSPMGLIRQYAKATAVLRIALSGLLIVVNSWDKSSQWLAHREAQRGVHLRESLLPGEDSAQEALERHDAASHIHAAEGEVFSNEHVSLLRPHGWRNQVVGKGAFGIVYKATWGGREVAVKEIILPQEPHDATDAARRLLRENTRKIKDEFVKEANISSKHSHHPNLVRLLGWADEPNLYLIQEFLSGQSLHSQLYVEGWQPTPADILKVAHDIAKGMTHLHEAFDAPVIHRDLKSANLMLTVPPADPSFLVKIADFGLTREARVDATMAGSTVGGGGSAAGTILWMAPELVLDDGRYDEKVDVFSYAMCLIELVNQERPWHGSGVRQETISVHLLQGKRPERQLERADLPLQQLIRDCWDRDASHRPPFSSIATRVEAMMGTGGEDGYTAMSRPASPGLEAVVES